MRRQDGYCRLRTSLIFMAECDAGVVPGRTPALPVKGVELGGDCAAGAGAVISMCSSLAHIDGNGIKYPFGDSPSPLPEWWFCS